MGIYEQCEVLSVNNLSFKAIGKIVLKSNSEWNIPHLHFMVNKSEDDIYEAICLELSFFDSGENIEEATVNLITNILSYFSNNVKSSSDMDKLIGNVDTNKMDMYWRKYRVFDYQLAKVGSDINSQLEKQIINKVENYYKNKIAEYENKIKQILTDENLELAQKYELNNLNIKEIA